MILLVCLIILASRMAYLQFVELPKRLKAVEELCDKAYRIQQRYRKSRITQSIPIVRRDYCDYCDAHVNIDEGEYHGLIFTCSSCRILFHTENGTFEVV